MITKIVNGRFVTENEVLEGKSLYFENGIITHITEKELLFDTLIDAGGNYVSAGFIELHAHGALDGDFADGDKNAVINAANYHCKHGTTTICPTTLSASYESIDSALKPTSENAYKRLYRTQGHSLENYLYVKENFEKVFIKHRLYTFKICL